MGKMEQENRHIPEDIYNIVDEALQLQRYITAKADANPHQYCLRREWKGSATFIGVANTIRCYGYVEWFWRKPYIL